MNIARALDIPGYMNEPALRWLAERAAEHKVIVELGCFCGRSTRALADNTPGVVYAIDDWQGVRKTQWGERTPEMEEEGRRSFLSFCQNMQDHILSDKVVVLKMDHANLAYLDWDPTTPPDMVFIDGDHDYESVARDIRVWDEKLAPGGLICGDDYSWKGVREALEDWSNLIKTVEGTELWYVE